MKTMPTTKTIDGFALANGAHYDASGGVGCVMELQSYLAGEPWSARPACTHPVIGAFTRPTNDAMDDATRERLLRPLLREGVLAGTAGGDSRRLAYHFADAAVRRFAPQALRAAGLISAAERLESLPPVVDKSSADAADSAAATAWAESAKAAESAAWAAQAAIRRRLAETGGGTRLPERRPVAAETRLRGRVDGMYRSKLERDFAGVLEGWRMAGYIVDWHYERLTLKLADGVRLPPDFLVGKGMCGRPVVYEVKGPYFRDDARIKLRVAAEQFSWLKWVLVQRQQGGWVYTTLGKEARQ